MLGLWHCLLIAPWGLSVNFQESLLTPSFPRQKSGNGKVSRTHVFGRSLSSYVEKPLSCGLPSAGHHQDSAAQIRTAEVAGSVRLCSSPHCCLEAGSLTEPSAVSASLISLWAFRIHLSLPLTHATVRNINGHAQIFEGIHRFELTSSQLLNNSAFPH